MWGEHAVKAGVSAKGCRHSLGSELQRCSAENDHYS